MSWEEEKSDLISRSELKEAINKIIDEEIKIDEKWAIGLKYSLKIIDNAPTIDAIPNEEGYEMYGKGYLQGYERGKKERSQGKWVKIFENPFTNGYVCPFCGHKIQITEQFLPKVTECEACGADMRGAE